MRTKLMVTAKDGIYIVAVVDEMLNDDVHYKRMCKKSLKGCLRKAQNFAENATVRQRFKKVVEM